MLAVNPYLSFNGTCETAFNFYKSVFGGDFEFIGRYKDIPGEDIPESEKDKIMHISLPLTEAVRLMGADSSEIFGQTTKFGDSVTLTLCTENEAETKRIFNALSEGGKIIMPLEKTFWADLYGMFTDKFGISWAINYAPNMNN
ncbi:VOC family protein [Dysgonomonas sp. ZJ279]|uniref:VOC family protein n=1 Tax=Dysgonomonas sp. ZJ279 TaxID=2709796 RepID=UPI0013E9B782|nr:VOC family protein [Dysgonomonas sp. ZJ279]